MLGYIRRNADSWLIKALLALIAVVFIFFFGSGALTSARDEAVAEVNGELIREQELALLFRRQLRTAQARSPGEMTDAQQQGIRQDSLDMLIETRLMRQQAEAEGLVASGVEIRRALVEDTYAWRFPWVIPSFQDPEANFDKEAYKSYLGEQPARAERRLQTSLREAILIDALQSTVLSSVQVAPAEVREAWEKSNSTRNVEFVRVTTLQFRDEVQPDEGELDAWSSENAEALSERYERDFDRKYSSPKQVQARHILLKFGEEEDDAKRTALRESMAGILVEARAEGADFAELAAKYSEDTSAARGGDLGFFDADRMVRPFSEAAFSMEVGQISEIVETTYGLHIIRVEAIQEASVQTLDEVRDEIVLELFQEERAPELAGAFAKRVVEVLDGTLDEAAGQELLTSRGLRIQESGDIDGSTRTIPSLGTAPEAISAAFALAEVGAVTQEPVEISNGFVVMRLKDKQDPDPESWEDERGDIQDRLLGTRQARVLEAYRTELKASADILVR